MLLRLLPLLALAACAPADPPLLIDESNKTAERAQAAGRADEAVSR